MPSFASSQDGLDEAQSPSSCASGYQFDGAFSKTSKSHARATDEIGKALISSEGRL